MRAKDDGVELEEVAWLKHKLVAEPRIARGSRAYEAHVVLLHYPAKSYYTMIDSTNALRSSGNMFISMPAEALDCLGAATAAGTTCPTP